MPREGKRFAKPGRAHSNLRRANARDELPVDTILLKKSAGEERASESVSAASDSAYSKDDAFDEDLQE